MPDLILSATMDSFLAETANAGQKTTIRGGIDAASAPIPVTGTQTIIATKASTYITYGSGTITFTDPDILTSVNGDHYKVIVGGTSSAIIAGVTYNVASPIEILRLVSAGSWITYSGTITLTGAVTGSGIGSFATTLSDDVVSLAKMANVATATVFYRKTAGTGDPEVQTLSTLKTDLGLTGTNSGDQDLSGLVTKLTPSQYTVTNPPAVPLKTFNASAATIDDVYNVLATLIQTLKDRQII